MLRKLSILTIFIGLWGCTPSPKVEITAETSSENLPLVVATTSVLCDLTKQADLIFYGGYNFDPSLIKLIKATSLYFIAILND
jgi:manganese/iron transport system substrate-binding protein